MWHSYKEIIRSISDAIVECQRPIRILEAIKTPQNAIDDFKKSNFKDIPKINPASYEISTLGYSPDVKISQFKDIRNMIEKEISFEKGLRELLLNTVDEYCLVMELIKARGSKRFYEISSMLYGSPKDTLLSDTNSVFEMSKLLYSILSGIKLKLEIEGNEKKTECEDAVKILQSKLDPYFNGEAQVMVSDGISADASAGGDKIKLRKDVLFSRRQLEILEVHEGWVHVATTLNGRKQPVATWLTAGPPRSTGTQEGLAVLMEIFTFRSSVERAQRINDRIMSIAKVEEGANLKEIFDYYRTEGYSEDECLNNSFRVFRGSTFDGGAPFTKDIAYCKGFVETYNFLRTAIRAGKPNLIPFLFSGKVHVEDVPLIESLHRHGIVDFPKFLPPHFTDMNGIAVWMSFSSFFNRVDLKEVQKHFNKLFQKYA